MSPTRITLHAIQIHPQIIGALVLALALWLPVGANAAHLHGKVVGVADGDIVTVPEAEERQHEIRLAGIDAPEKTQAFDQASKKSLSDKIFDHEIDVNWDKRHRNGRIISKISAD